MNQRILTTKDQLRVALDEALVPGSVLGFDIGDVLDPYNGNHTRQRISEHTGVPVSTLRDEMYFGQHAKNCMLGKCASDVFAREFIRELQLPISEQELLALFLEGHGEPDYETVGLVAEFRWRVERTFILSNNNDHHTSFIRVNRSHILEPFDYVWFSQEIGYAKPDDECFAYVEQELGKCKRIVFVDDQEKNVDAMRARGWHAIWYTNAGRPREW